MKTTKKLLALALAVLLVMSLATTAFAARDTEHVITINNVQPGHTYEAYQVFSGIMSDGKLTEITWGNGVNGDNLLAALKADTTFNGAFNDAANAEDVAEVLDSFADNSAELDAFAAVVGKYLAAVAGTSEETKSPYTISVVGDGYYFVKDKDGSIPAADAYTKYMLRVVGDVNVTAKSDFPTLEKKIDGDNDGDEENKGLVDANTSEIGDTVPYVLTSKVPNMDGYNAYIYIIHDKMTEGLTFLPETLKVFVGGVEQTLNTNYKLNTTGLKDDCTFEIEFINFIQYTAGAEIKVTFDALINENAVIGNSGNPNDAMLTYSNNPNYDYTPDKPDENAPVGETPWDTVITYLTEIELIKVDGETKAILTGAKFQIAGVSSKVKVINKLMFVKDAAGTFYRLKDGTYTETPSTAETAALYESTTVKYRKVETVTEETVEEDFVAEGWVDANGKLTFTGLGEGTYTITELVAPNGYNLLKAPITVVITASDDDIEDPTHATTVTWTATAGTENSDWEVTDDGKITITVENTSGATLPETGGMGTTLFYVIGGLLVAGAVVLLVTKKRMGAAA